MSKKRETLRLKNPPKTKAKTYDGAFVAPTPEAVKRLGKELESEIKTATDKKGRQRVVRAGYARKTVFDKVGKYLMADEASIAERLQIGWRHIERASGEGSGSTWGMGPGGGGGKAKMLPTGLLEFDSIQETQEILKRIPSRARSVIRQVVLDPDGRAIGKLGALILFPRTSNNVSGNDVLRAAVPGDRALGALVGATRAALWSCLQAADDMADAKREKVRRAKAEQRTRSAPRHAHM